MKFDKDTKILIIGLGVIGGSYAKALSDKGYTVKCITKEESDVKYALKNNMISYGTDDVDPALIAEAELIVFALYPATFIEWIKKYNSVRGWEVTVTTQNAIDNMLNAWEKENGEKTV